MLNKLQAFLQENNMICPGDTVICAVSGGADSMALLWGLYLLKDQLGFALEAAHFDHQLRESSQRDAAFVAEFCDRFDIPLHLGTARVEKGEKGLEAAAREARYAFFKTLTGKIATAHTANDNLETLLMNLVRGSGLKGLGAIAPVADDLIRPMLDITRQEVLDFLAEYHISHVEDETNAGDQFLRNRIRHHVIPALTAENPRLAENVSAMARRLRLDEEALDGLARQRYTCSVTALRDMEPAIRIRVLERFLKECGIKEPTARHLELAQGLVFSDNPSAWASFPGEITIARCYDRLQLHTRPKQMPDILVPCPGGLTLRQPGLRITCREATQIINTPYIFTVHTQDPVWLGSRRTGDAITLPGGTRSLKKLFIDRKIPAFRRLQIPVLRDRNGILGVYGIGAHEDRKAKQLPAVQFVFEKIED